VSRTGASDGCGCFPTGRYYAGIAHLLRAVARGVLDELDGEAAWYDLPVALLDVETTGRDASSDRVIEIGIIIAQGGEIIRRHQWMVNPEKPIPDEAKAIHGIGDEDVKGAPRFAEIAAEVVAALAGCIPAAYNAPFDRAFVANELARAHSKGEGDAAAPHPFLRTDVVWIDPLIWARELHSHERSRTLGDVAARLGITIDNAHRATDDAEAAMRVLYAFGKDARVPRQYAPFIQEQRRLAMAQADARQRIPFRGR
jgi:DNA polymerase-3 subunit epsilon